MRSHKVLKSIHLKDVRNLDLRGSNREPQKVMRQAFIYKQRRRGSLREFFQQIREHMEVILNGIVSDHWSTVI